MVTIDLRHVKTAGEAEAAMKGGLRGVPTPAELAAQATGRCRICKGPLPNPPHPAYPDEAWCRPCQNDLLAG